MPNLDEDTIRLLDDVETDWCIQIVYLDEKNRERMAIGNFSHLDHDPFLGWLIFRQNCYVGIRLIDVVSIERVVKNKGM